MDEEQLWLDILAIEYNPAQAEEILGKYRHRYAVGRLTVSSYETLWRFTDLNLGKDYHDQIKPYNFITVGIGYMDDPETGKKIIPMLPYVDPKSDDFDAIPHMPFTDYKTGKTYDNEDIKDGRLSTSSYWQPLTEVVTEYMKHPEAKSMGDENTRGPLQRKHVVLDPTSLHYIGKETNKLEEAEVIGVDSTNYTEYIKWKGTIEHLTPEQAEKVGISRRNLSYLKKKAKGNQQISLTKNTKQCLVKRLGQGDPGMYDQ